MSHGNTAGSRSKKTQKGSPRIGMVKHDRMAVKLEEEIGEQET